MNSRDKGCRGEREWRDEIRAAGYEAERGQQHAGGADAPDVKHNIPGIHFEVKRTERFSLGEAMYQAIRDAGDKIPVVAHRRNRHPWVVILKSSDFFQLLKEAGR